ncbi:MAG TPA: cofactor assembly of complex C subunit B [Leptolyngbyaceae cyanobacterium]
MDTAILPSTFVLTLLLAVGLFFFIRASTKDRTETAKLISDQEEAVFMPQLQEYFRSRSYRVAEVDHDKNQVTFEGFVKPSIFLATFLTLLASVGLICLSLVFALLLPGFGKIFFGLVLFAPLSGLFYWQKAGRVEKVLLKLEPQTNQQQSFSKITVVAHRDELIELQKVLPLKPAE